MELIKAYMDKIKRIRGLYVLSVDLSEEETMELLHAWEQMQEKGFVDHPILIIPTGASLTHEVKFTFERAIQVVRAGGKVRRATWHQGLYLEEDGNSNSIIVTSKYFDGDELYTISIDDMNAIDWELYEGEKKR